MERIKEHATNLQVKQDQIDLRERQKKVETNHRRRNEKLGQVNEDYLDELLDRLTNEELTDFERESTIKEIRATREELSKIQRDERTTEHLPNSYKDITNDVNLNAGIDANLNGDVSINLLDKVKAKRRELNGLHSD